jgi:tetratricopeptide (TPR) repeat protein
MTIRGPRGGLSMGLLAAWVLTVLPAATPASAAANPNASKCGVAPTADRNEYFAKIIKQNDDSQDANDFRRALACSQWLVDVFLKAPDIDAYNQSAILFRHAENLKALGGYIEADPVYRRALSLQDEDPADPDNLKLKIMGGLADNDADQRKYTEAAKLDETALGLWVKKYGPDGQDVAPASDNLGIIYDYMGRYAEAEPLHQKALDIRSAAPAGNEYELALGENNFGYSYHQRGDYAKAEEYYRKASDLYLKIGANHDRWAIVNHVNLANLYADEHRLDLAEKLY